MNNSIAFCQFFYLSDHICSPSFIDSYTYNISLVSRFCVAVYVYPSNHDKPKIKYIHVCEYMLVVIVMLKVLTSPDGKNIWFFNGTQQMTAKLANEIISLVLCYNLRCFYNLNTLPNGEFDNSNLLVYILLHQLKSVCPIHTF